MVKTRDSFDVAKRATDALLAFIGSERPHIELEAVPLIDELEALIKAGGKRIRPRCCFWGYVAAGGNGMDEIVRVGAALELLHTFAVIHDDVMDRSPMRRKQASSFTRLAEETGDARLGASAAILTGLLGFVLADRLFLTSGFTADAMARASERFDRMRTRTIAGQYLDLLAAHHGKADEATARRIGGLKSAGYTIADPLAIGALCASPDVSVVSMLDRFGFPLGEAFQIRDDVLGTFGEISETGKDRDGDLREGKQTVLLAKTRALAGGTELDLIDRVVGDDNLSADDGDRVRDIIVSSGALDATNELIDELTRDAVYAIDEALVDDVVSAALRDLAAEVTQRRG